MDVKHFHTVIFFFTPECHSLTIAVSIKFMIQDSQMTLRAKMVTRAYKNLSTVGAVRVSVSNFTFLEVKVLPYTHHGRESDKTYGLPIDGTLVACIHGNPAHNAVKVKLVFAAVECNVFYLTNFIHANTACRFFFIRWHLLK